jgi:enoyl-CoA hydratase/carnithine racemase
MPRSDLVQKSFKVEKVPSGIAVITFDIPGESVNTLSEEGRLEFEALLEELTSDSEVKAAVLISGKADNFVAGAKIDLLQRLSAAVWAVGSSWSWPAPTDSRPTRPRPHWASPKCGSGCCPAGAALSALRGSSACRQLLI